MSWEIITGIFTAAVILTVAIYDISVWCCYGEDATISCSVRRMNTRWPLLGPMVSFIMGCIYGHIFL